MKNQRPNWIANTATKVGEKTRWREVGVGFDSEKGTITVLLDALPVGGKLILTRPKERLDTEGRREE